MTTSLPAQNVFGAAMWWSLSLLLAAFGVLYAGASYAGSATLTCTPPTQNADGTPLTDLADIRAYYGNTPGGPYPNVVSIGVGCTGVIENLAAAEWFFVVTAVNESGIESVFSNEATKVIEPTAPAPPTNLVVTDEIAYSYSITKDKLVMLPVGTVPAGTPCDTSMSMNGLYLVPWDSVNFAGTTKPAVNFAACGSGS